ncbi:hypothetical protein CCR94_01235 [Rhodoblastus sphagnicola]|uniref:Type I-E CRISPR-associated protein Cse2/CasB n=1 Tax=Rhodoblastus sphagnicola TaxID=333368 RepID=A0A2S6NFU7_9HYPH|nr:type I-E CRISPR-associated protein Cse2/CasB [Rhodoblastus sphagnicola]MBB4199538.1 CRISPR system Cascade subunit CasB [Rhodoblastus sphagnicola]PPQ33508.1 hypothetical protein CCR94_01235 [Rhodoblastus sphagnicola]
MTQLDAPEQTASPEEERGIGFALVNEVRGLLNAERRGDLAELRRLDPDQPQAPAFFRILARVAPEAGVESMRRYAHYLRILALNPDALSNDRLGAVMAAAGLSESRVQRMLTARGESLHDQLRLIARRLANAGNVPWSGFRDLLLTTDEDKVERKRMMIARDYWRALDRQQSQS